MTDEERRNRNPKSERGTIDLSQHPEVLWWDLEFGRVYVLVGKHVSASFNYAGPQARSNPTDPTDERLCHVFHGPRVGIEISLIAQPDGKLQDGAGQTIPVHRYMGEDA